MTCATFRLAAELYPSVDSLSKIILKLFALPNDTVILESVTTVGLANEVVCCFLSFKLNGILSLPHVILAVEAKEVAESRSYQECHCSLLLCAILHGAVPQLGFEPRCTKRVGYSHLPYLMGV